jgi:hypothetical protein
MARRSITWDDRTLYNRLRTFNARADRFLTAAIGYHATRAQSYARSNARWTDRTGNARNGLFAKAERDAPKYRIVIGGSVPYQVWLEVRFSGRYAILRPTVDHEAPELMRTVSTMFQKLI